MSEATQEPSAACPLPLDVLPGNFQKHVDGKAPVPLRMMGAKGLVPMGPKDLATALFMLGFDPEPSVRETSRKTAGGLPDRILAVALRDETVAAPVLDFYASLFASKVEYLEMLVLNSGTADETIARIAGLAGERLLELIAQNQLRLLRFDGIVRALVQNTAARPDTVDSVTDFCVRSGLVLEDLEPFRAARRRILGGSAGDEQAAAEAAVQRELEEAEAESMLEQLGATAPDGVDAPAAPGSSEEEEQPLDTKKLSITQQVSRLSVAKKIEWANKKGNKEVRTLLLRDPNKLVQMAVIQSPRITETEVAKVAQSRTAPNEVLSHIYNSRQLMKNYSIKVSLVNNPKVPVGVAMRFLSLLRSSELKALAKNKNVASTLASAARRIVEKKD